MKWKLFIVICFLTLIFTVGCNKTEISNIEEQKTGKYTKLTLEIVKKLSKKGDKLSWEDFQTYDGGKDIGSGLYIKWYPIDDKYEILIGGGSLKERPMYIYLVNKDIKDTQERIDIRDDDIDKFINNSKDIKPSSNKDHPYTSETAIKNGDVVNLHGKEYNVEKLEQFMENVKKGVNDKIRITQYTVEGGAIITDLEYDGEKINYTYDTTRDNWGAKKIEKKKLDVDTIYKSGSKYYFKSTPDDILIY